MKHVEEIGTVVTIESVPGRRIAVKFS